MTWKAAILPTPGDPFHVTYWLRNFATWSQYVDELVVFVNGQKNPAVLGYIAEQVAKAGGVLFSQPERKDHGSALDWLIRQSGADLYLFCEDDAFVREPTAIRHHFAFLDEFELIGSPRDSASGGVQDAAYRRWGPAPLAYDGCAGHGLFPAFLFGRRETLHNVSTFSARQWHAGDYIAPLDYTCETEEASDTAGLASYELRDKGTRTLYVPQFRSKPEQGPWFHVGSLSSGYGNAWSDDTNSIRVPQNVMGDPDWPKRVSWWERFYRTGDFPSSQARYRAGLDSLYAAGIDRAEVENWTARYDALITWPEGVEG